MSDRAGLFRKWRSQPRNRPKLSFGTWDELAESQPRVVQVCHPNWRGVRTVAYSFRGPIVECDDLEAWSNEILRGLHEAGVSMVVVQGWPPGAASFARQVTRAGITVKCVLHSSPAQHAAESWEIAALTEVLALVAEGALAELGMAKAGVHEAFGAIGIPVAFVPNRVPEVPHLPRVPLGEGRHVGVFAEPMWRKNMATQLLAAALLDATAHVIKSPDVPYVESVKKVEHGLLPWDQFIALQGSTDINLYVTLSECHPSTPQESYLWGVPCLMSRTSAVFRSDPVLWDLTTTDEADNPEAIATAARRLLDAKDEAVARARGWMDTHDATARQLWEEFTAS